MCVVHDPQPVEFILHLGVLVVKLLIFGDRFSEDALGRFELSSFDLELLRCTRVVILLSFSFATNCWGAIQWT